MIPADVASRLRLTVPDQPAAPQATTPAGKLTDVLSDLVPGQRIMAEIQALLPNGMYRAVVAQRDITLALPFSAKTGDALELEVVDSDGKLTLAFVANRGSGDQSGKAAGESVSTSLSQTGKLIGDLLGSIDDQGRKGRAVPLNGNQPLLADFPKDAGQLAPVLKEALTKSGMFYEAHQARWVEGKLPVEALLQEPQGKFSKTLHPDTQTATTPKVDIARVEPEKAAAGAASEQGLTQKSSVQSPIPPDLAPMVRQQLDALATQNYVWQGQVWPGQQLHWEIEEDKGARKDKGEGEGEHGGHQWHTRLKLTLPGLGGIEAVMHLRTAGSIDVSLVTDNDESRHRLVAAGDALRQQLETAGLNLTGLAVNHGESAG